jgi:hypothetical protein
MLSLTGMICPLINGFLLLTACGKNVSESANNENPQERYALLIGGGYSPNTDYNSFYANIFHVYTKLVNAGFKAENIKVLHYKGQSKNRPIVDGDATKGQIDDAVDFFASIVDENDIFLLFRSGHGTVEVIYEKYGIVSEDNPIPAEETNIKSLGTIAVMQFQDGIWTYLEFADRMKKINSNISLVVLNQCYAEEFVKVSQIVENTIIITETASYEFAFNMPKTQDGTDIWEFVACIFEGLLASPEHTANFNVIDIDGDNKASVQEAFKYQIECNPNCKGMRIHEQVYIQETPHLGFGPKFKDRQVFIIGE